MKILLSLSLFVGILTFLGLASHAYALNINGNHPGTGNQISRDNNSPTGYSYKGNGGGGNDTENNTNVCGDECLPRDLSCTVVPNRPVISTADFDTPVIFAFEPPVPALPWGIVKRAGMLSGLGDIPILTGTGAVEAGRDNLTLLQNGTNLISLRYGIDRSVPDGEVCYSGGANQSNEKCYPKSRIVTDTYTCTTEVELTDGPITECNDGKDNSDGEDTLSDEGDPGCHTDGDPKNPSTYDPNDNDEANGLPNLVAGIRALRNPIAPNSYLYVRVTATNTEPVAIRTPSIRAITWELLGSGNDQELAYTAWGTYGAATTTPADRDFVWSATKSGGAPSVPGTYKICFIVDTGNIIEELNESDNVACTEIDVEDTALSTVDLTIRKKTSETPGPWRESVTVREGEEAELRMEPVNMTECRVASGNFELNDTQDDNQTQRIDLGGRPAGNYTFEVRCKGADGVWQNDDAVLTVNNFAVPSLTGRTPVRKGMTSTLTWDTGGRRECVIQGTNGDRISAAVQNSSEPTIPLTAQTVYTMTCDDDPDLDLSATIDILPSIIEF